MEQLLPKGIPTLRALATGTYTRPDNIFASRSLAQSLLSCNVYPHLQPPKTDHFPVVTHLDVTPPPARTRRRRKWSEVAVWDDYTEALEERLPRCPNEEEEIGSVGNLRKELTEVMKALQGAAEKTVKYSRPPPLMRRWWNKDLKTQRNITAHLGRRSYRYRDYRWHPVHAEYRTARNTYANMIAQAKADHWDKWLRNANTRTIWDYGRFAKARPPVPSGSLYLPPDN
ncbi:hypothetical protein BXZ70DRAFT_1001870 [Cristinia sonorae]|uniref:Uncharacterized protein n=1 Tax=Cristinia sonorae TaxID=1940300 RepID=A0A8K0UJV8_9AGAR|nr:hypothetical protein BXZ70DRAFT_1001870 [Cristinia sonorae]